MRCTAQQIYDILLGEDKILELQGQIRFQFGDVGIVVKQKDTLLGILFRNGCKAGWINAALCILCRKTHKCRRIFI